jgi:hypothetical protein
MTLFLEGLGRIDRPVKRIAKGHNKTIASVADHFIFARVKCIMSGLKKTYGLPRRGCKEQRAAY